MTAQHTPGPWHVGTSNASRVIYADGHGYAVANATVYHTAYSEETTLANARLIAAAPELLAALEYLYQSVLDGDNGNIEAAMPRARAAIAKATGT